MTAKYRYPRLCRPPLERNFWDLCVESYSIDVELRLPDGKIKQLYCAAWGHGNMTALVNDCVIDPIEDVEVSRPQWGMMCDGWGCSAHLCPDWAT